MRIKMGVQYSTAVRKGMLDAIEVQTGPNARVVFYTGTKPATCATAASGSVIATLELTGNSGDWMSAAVDAVRRAKKARIDPAPAKTTIKRPVEQITTTSRAQAVFAKTDSSPIDATAQTVWMGVVQQVKPIHAIRGDK